MSLFKKLVPFTVEQAAVTADALHQNRTAAVMVDPRPAYMLLVPSTARGLPYEVDFVVVEGDIKTPVGMTRQQHARLMLWAGRTIPLVCRTWKERHPEA